LRVTPGDLATGRSPVPPPNLFKKGASTLNERSWEAIMKTVKVAACAVALSGITAGAAVVASTYEGQTRAKTVRTGKFPSTAVFGGSRLGISVREVEAEDVKSARLPAPTGAVVEDVSESSAAQKAGMRKGDVIVEFDGDRVRSARQLTRLVEETPAGRKVPAIVIRDGQRVTLNVEPDSGGAWYDSLQGLEDWGRNIAVNVRPVLPPVPPAPPVPATPPGWRMDEFFYGGSGRLGITVDSLSSQLADYFGTKEGVLVTSVQDNSAGAKAGLKAGDVITGVNGSAVDDPAELRRRLQNINGGEEFTLAIVRDKKPQTLKGKLEQTTRRRTYRSLI
jgi:serine protease Do